MLDIIRNIFGDMKVADYVAISGSIVAMIVSVYALVESHKKDILSTVTANRTKWLEDVKRYTHEYFKEYLKNKSDKYSLKVCEARIRLYFRSDGDSYGNMAEQLKKCSTEQFSNEDYEKLLEYSQNVLRDMWRQMKLEAGINTKKQDKIHKKMARYSRNRYRSQKNDANT
ncbi:hypothetical protein FACS1894170_03050 [Planctomycetales bacterium]|nr:hypothetical protein FACS1894170_03050 [Planctomycetales bacterium]